MVAQSRIYKPAEEPENVRLFRAKARENEYGFLSHHLKIRTQQATIDYLRPNWSQQQILRSIYEDEKARKPVRKLILKSRRVGASTICSGRAFSKGYLYNNTEVMIMAHLNDVTEKLFQMQHLFLKMLNPDIQIPLKRSNKKELVWDAINSKIFLLTAGSTHSSRSTTIMHALASEVAFYKNLAELRGAIEATVPELAGTSVIYESTAFGAGTEFHDLWLAATNKDIYYDPIWLEWFRDPNCQAPEFPSQKVQDAVLEELFGKFPDLEDRQKAFRLTPRQIFFYGNILRNKYSGNELLMQQEYPCTPEEAFLASGTPVFPAKMFERYKNRAYPGQRYEINTRFTTLGDAVKNSKLRHYSDSYFEIWVPPQAGRHYLIAADPSRGLIGRDYSAAVILDIVTQDVVGVIHGHLDLKLFAQVLIKLCKIYNEAILMPEVTGIGAGLLSHLKDQYFNIYQQRKDDGYRINITHKLGWETTQSSRLAMVASCRTKFVERYEHYPERWLPCRAIIDEICTFVQGNLNKPEAENNCHDDFVIALAMGVQGCLDELKARPDLLASVQFPTTSDSREQRRKYNAEEVLDMWKSPDFIFGQPFEFDFPDEPFTPYTLNGD